MMGNQDILLKEQYLDFLKCRRYRQTLLCHREIQLDCNLKSEQVTDFYLASRARPVSTEPDIRSRIEEEFRGAKGAALRTDHPLAKAAILLLCNAWPGSVHFQELLAMARAFAGLDIDQDPDSLSRDAHVLGEVILGTYAAGLVELHYHVPHFVTEVSEHPTASLLARLQAQNSTIVTNFCHAAINLVEGPGRHLLSLLDGTRDRSALSKEMEEILRTGACGDRERNFKNLPEELELWLAEFARLALLVA
jgi:methyltransferase-like protein